MEILKVLQAAAAFVPTLVSAYETVRGALSPASNTPVQPEPAVNAAVAEIEEAALTEPALQGLAPMVAKAVSGTAFTDGDLATLRKISDQIDAAVSKAETDVKQ